MKPLKILRINNKGSRQDMLPSRKAVNMLTKNSRQPSMNDYSKVTPVGGGAAMQTYDGIMQQGQQGVTAAPALSPGSTGDE